MITTAREEQYLAKVAGEDVPIPEPKTRVEMYLAKMAGMDVVPPAPITREEQILSAIAENGGGGGGGDSLSLIGQVTVQSTLNYYITGGIWEYQDTKKTNPDGGADPKVYNVYGASGETSIKCQIINLNTNYSINPAYATTTGSVSLTGYTYVISGNGTISIED